MFPFPMWSPWGGLSPSCFPAPPPLPAVPARRGSDLPRATAPLAGHGRGGQLCLGVPLLLGAPLGGAGGRQRGDSCKRGGTGMQVAPCTNAVPPSHPPLRCHPPWGRWQQARWAAGPSQGCPSPQRSHGGGCGGSPPPSRGAAGTGGIAAAVLPGEWPHAPSPPARPHSGGSSARLCPLGAPRHHHHPHGWG